MIKPESIENLKSLIDIVDVISNYVTLKKAGSNYKALCPFHSEKTPSFVVSPAKQIYHCFGCGVSGDAIKFVMEIEKLSYKEAIEKLAALYNFQLEYTSNKNFLNISLLDKVNAFYKSKLFEKKDAFEYLKKRGLKESTIEKFELGYAPTSTEQLRFFKNANLNENELIKLGVLTDTKYPRLIERITFPIFSQSGKIIAFGGRTITNHPAKYINFTNTKLFNKSKTFYGLNFAREHILRNKEAIIVEGYMDVIMLHQAGFENAIATLGTALTPQHLPILKKLDCKITISYDSDSAGINAALKASKLLYKEFFEGGVVLFEEGKDPADMVKENKNLNEIFNKKTSFLEFILEYTSKKYNLKNPIEKKKAIDELKEYINTLPDILKEDFIINAARYLQVDERVFSIKTNFQTNLNLHKKIDIAEASIIKTLYEKKELMDEIVEYLDPKMFNTHSNELSLVYQEEFENPALLEIVLRDDVIIYNKETLKNQIRKILISFYQQEIKRVKFSNLDIHEKMHILKNLNIKLQKLKKGELIESYIAI